MMSDYSLVDLPNNNIKHLYASYVLMMDLQLHSEMNKLLDLIWEISVDIFRNALACNCCLSAVLVLCNQLIFIIFALQQLFGRLMHIFIQLSCPLANKMTRQDFPSQVRCSFFYYVPGNATKMK